MRFTHVAKLNSSIPFMHETRFDSILRVFGPVFIDGFNEAFK